MTITLRLEMRALCLKLNSAQSSFVSVEGLSRSGREGRYGSRKAAKRACECVYGMS